MCTAETAAALQVVTEAGDAPGWCWLQGAVPTLRMGHETMPQWAAAQSTHQLYTLVTSDALFVSHHFQLAQWREISSAAGPTAVMLGNS